MTKKLMTICDLCNTVVEKGYVLEIREDLPQNAVGNIESWDLCLECRKTMQEFLRSKKPSDVPIITVE